jgi:DNA primase
MYAVPGRVKDEDIALVRDRTSIADVVGETVTLRPAGGGNLKGLCPFHDEKTPSFTVSPARNVYFCLAGETRVITDAGVREIRDLAGGRHRVITTDGRFVDAPFYSFGEQPVVRLRLSRDGRRKTVRATTNHRWFVRTAAMRVLRTTAELRPGDRLAHVYPGALSTSAVVGRGGPPVDGGGVAVRQAVRAGETYDRHGWVVAAVEDHGEVEEVFCPVVERTHAFVLEDDILTGNCHGCGVGGDAIKFVMDAEHLTFVESVERLAAKAGLQLRYDETGPAAGPARQPGLRQRLTAAHAAAADFYRDQLRTAGARAAREFLAQRGFGRDAAERYGCGFAPDAWDALGKHLRQRGFTAEELTTGGLAKPARSGTLIDRFRRRLLWPIRDLGGDVIGFGARRLFDDDDGPKYLNTPETPLYKKSHVLYGIDQAKREIAKQGRAVIVEGYTDVMACHEAGVPTAVATCGTAFGADHIGVLRRLLMDSDSFAGEIIFTFDGDAAGQKAALRAFEEDQRFVGRTFIAVSPDNMDPCELRLAKGDLAVKDLVARREPLVDFALRQILSRFDLDTVEGRVEAMRRAAPLVAKIKDREKRPEYARKLAGDLGMDVDPVQRAVAAATPGEAPAPRIPAPRADSPQRLVEREVLKLALQHPVLAGPMFDTLGPEMYFDPVLRAVREAVAAAGGTATATGGVVWIEAVRDACADLSAKAVVGELAVEPLHLDGEADPRYVSRQLARLQVPAVTARIREIKSKVQRINPVTHRDAYFALAGELIPLEQHAKALKQQAADGL